MKKYYQFIKNYFLIISILSILLFSFVFGSYLSLNLKKIAYTISYNMRIILMYILPFLVYPLIVSSIVLTKINGFALLFTLLLLILISNFTSILIGAGVAYVTLPFLSFTHDFIPQNKEILPSLFSIDLKPLINIESLLLVGIISGIFLNTFQSKKIKNYIEKWKKLSILFFKNFFVRLLPLYILGTVLKLNAENNFYNIFRNFGSIIFLIILTQFLYILIIFWVGTNFSFKNAISCWKNSLPAALFGFSSMSSLITMPITIKAAEKNLKNKDIANISITTTVNCHDVGECISLAFLTLAIYFIGNDLSFPPITIFMNFAVVFALAQFTGVSIPGGSVVVIAPLLTAYLGFSEEMVGIITAVSIFMDPIGTSNNIMGNSAFALILSKCWLSIPNLINKINILARKKKAILPGATLISNSKNTIEAYYEK